MCHLGNLQHEWTTLVKILKKISTVCQFSQKFLGLDVSTFPIFWGFFDNNASIYQLFSLIDWQWSLVARRTNKQVIKTKKQMQQMDKTKKNATGESCCKEDRCNSAKAPWPGLWLLAVAGEKLFTK